MRVGGRRSGGGIGMECLCRSERPVLWLGRIQGMSDIVAHPRHRSSDGVPSKICNSSRALHLGVALEVTHHGKAFYELYRAEGEAMSQGRNAAHFRTGGSVPTGLR